ncbi:MAG: 4-diphosphocytidyl-2-C-methyl-D-erythritol kinase [Chloroflexota bacterium]|nr:4-diphosphocytidyl-2-C-methyl-D-erythritol kinase [Chloroflexota bacterium]
MTLVVPARAKLNLDLAVIARTKDGFHELRTHMQAIELHDLLELQPADRTTMTSTGFPVPHADNSVLKAHAATQQATGRDLPTQFHLDKKIPPGSGMGGASSDAAAALRGLKAIHHLIDMDIAGIASSIGADVPFFIHGGHALAEGRGDRLTALPTQPAWFAIAWPGIELSTAAVYRAWDDVNGVGANHLSKAAGHLDARVNEFAERLGNDWQMTGSGSAFFRRCAGEAAAQKAIEKLDCWTAITRSVEEWS